MSAKKRRADRYHVGHSLHFSKIGEEYDTDNPVNNNDDSKGEEMEKKLKKKKITLMLALSINWMQMTMIIRRTVPMTMGRTVALKTKRYELRGMRRIVTAMSMMMRIMGKREE